MATQNKNPFITLGFAPAIFSGLSDEDIRSLVGAQYRALVSLFHPDRRGGKTEQFKEIQEAMDGLKEDHEFDFWKRMFLRKRKDQVLELEREKAEATAMMNAFQAGLTSFWVSYCKGRKVFRYQRLVEKAVKTKKRVSGFSIFNPPAMSLLMMDRFDALVRADFLGKKRKSALGGVKQKKLSSAADWNTIVNSSELRILPKGGIVKQSVVKTFFDAREKWRPPVNREWVALNSAIPTKSYYWKPQGEPVKLQGRLLGSMPSRSYTATGVSVRSGEIEKLISADSPARTVDLLQRGYTLYEFEPYLRFIQPIVRDCHFLIMAEGSDADSLRFKILGYPFKIVLLDKATL